MSQLKYLTITDPTVVEALPHTNALRSLRVLGLPHGQINWEWLQSAAELDEIEIVMRGNTSLEDSLNSVLPLEAMCPEHLKIQDNCAEVTIFSAELLTIFTNLPTHIRRKVI